MNEYIIKKFYGKELKPYLLELAKLRIEVFREFPYLYEGSIEYEQNYLSSYVNSRNSIVALIFFNDIVVGATTALPLVDWTYDKKTEKLFCDNGFDVNKVFYFGESIILKEHRERGFGKQFFDIRENRAKQLNFEYTVFCAVKRPEDHPRKPPDYFSPEYLWRKRGYKKDEKLITTYSWQDLDELSESEKKMIFWVKKLN